MKIAVIGNEQFALGFRLAGVKRVFLLPSSGEKNVGGALQKAVNDPEIGLVIIDEEEFESLNALKKREIEGIVMPVIVRISRREKKEELGRLIKKSLGVDLWSS